MLTLTENASTIVKTLTDQSPDETAGLRISSSNPDSTAFAAAVTPEPEASDQVVESGGARIFLETQAAQVLDDKVLDAPGDEQGGGSFPIGALA